MYVAKNEECHGCTVSRVSRGKPILEMVGADSYTCDVTRRSKRVGRNSLSRVTGGAKGRGEHTRSFMNDERYAPDARTNTKLSMKVSCETSEPNRNVGHDSP